MTREDVRNCKRLFDEKDAAENDVMQMENLIRWFKETPEEYDLRLLLSPVQDLKRVEVSISHCFKYETLERWLVSLKNRAETYKTLCEGLKWQPPQEPKDEH